jgi:regulator of sigma E protease
MFFIQFAIILIILVVIHEFGHFIAAKKSGVRVEEFGVGLPPRLFGKKFGKAPTAGEDDDRTLYSINALPIGGFVRMTGEDAAYLDQADPKNFQNAALWKRMVIVLAGVFMNFVLGILLFTVVYSNTGIPTDPHVVLKEVVAGSPAESAGLMKDDRVVSIAGEEIKNSTQMQQIIKKHLDESIPVVVKRSAGPVTVSITPRKNPPKDQGALGVVLSQSVEYTHHPWYVMPFHAAKAGLEDTVAMAQQIVPALQELGAAIIFKQQVPETVAGPYGIAQVSKLFCEAGLLPCLQFAGLLSINLAVFNLLPFPALDGGRFVFMVYEGITRRKPNPKFEQWTHAIGFAVLILLFIVVTFKDIFNPFTFK